MDIERGDYKQYDKQKNIEVFDNQDEQQKNNPKRSKKSVKYISIAVVFWILVKIINILLVNPETSILVDKELEKKQEAAIRAMEQIVEEENKLINIFNKTRDKVTIYQAIGTSSTAMLDDIILDTLTVRDIANKNISSIVYPPEIYPYKTNAIEIGKNLEELLKMAYIIVSNYASRANKIEAMTRYNKLEQEIINLIQQREELAREVFERLKIKY